MKREIVITENAAKMLQDLRDHYALLTHCPGLTLDECACAIIEWEHSTKCSAPRRRRTAKTDERVKPGAGQ